jgi:hypothetical protein
MKDGRKDYTKEGRTEGRKDSGEGGRGGGGTCACHF